MATKEEELLEQRLKAALWFSIGKIVDEETLKLGVNATPQFIGSLTEMVWAQIGNSEFYPNNQLEGTERAVTETVSQDLESFSKHAGRTTISMEDVLLLSRRNEGLEDVLRNFLSSREPRKSKAPARR